MTQHRLWGASRGRFCVQWKMKINICFHLVHVTVMLCYVMLCYVMLCYVMLCYVMLILAINN